MTVMEIAVVLLLVCGNCLGAAVWRELREMRKRAGLLPPRRRVVPVRKL